MVEFDMTGLCTPVSFVSISCTCQSPEPNTSREEVTRNLPGNSFPTGEKSSEISGEGLSNFFQNESAAIPLLMIKARMGSCCSICWPP